MYDEVVPLDIERPATVIVPSDDRTLRASWMEHTAIDRLGVTAATIDSGHCPHVSRPSYDAEISEAIADFGP